MLRAMDSAVAGLRAHQNKLDVISNNIANVNTFGFKSQSYSFKEAMYQTSTNSTGGITGENASAAGTNGAQYGYGTMMGSITTDMSASTPSYVGGLNASINRNGFFITSPVGNLEIDLNGEDATSSIKESNLSYTRVGKFQLDSQGYLTDGTNFVYGFAAGDDGEVDTTKLVPIRCATAEGAPLQALSVKINTLGEITVQVSVEGENGKEETKEQSLGKVAIASFQNQEGLMKSGGNYYTASISDNSGMVSATVAGGAYPELMTGYLEASNVDLAREFAEMITTQRGFQANSKIITVSDEILADLINMKR